MVRTPLSPNQVTVLSFLVILPGAYLLSTGERMALIGAGLLIQLSFTLDCCDGEIARLRGLSSPFGAWLDGLFDRIAELALCLALGHALERQSGDPHAYLYSFVVFASLAMTHIATLMNAAAFGKGQLAESASRGLLGRLANFVRIPPLKLRNYLRRRHRRLFDGFLPWARCLTTSWGSSIISPLCRTSIGWPSS